MAGWNADTAAGPLGAGAVTLVEGSSFCISAPNGDIQPALPHGLFVQDTRLLSRWELSVNDQQLEPLTAEQKEPYRALFVGRVTRTDGYADSPLVVKRLREVGAGLTEQITLRNYSRHAVECSVSLRIEADFADLFEVKEARVRRNWESIRQIDGEFLTIRGTWQDVSKSVTVMAPQAYFLHDGVLTYRSVIEAHGQWQTVITAVPESVESTPAIQSFVRSGTEGLSPRDERRRAWVSKIPVLHISNRSIERTLQRSYDDLGSLRIEDPAHPDRVVVAAGAPWFMTLFGRDSLWASEMALPVDPSLALGTLQTLASRQGEVINATTEEEPGKILHEVRLDVSSGEALGGKSAYYGSVDATPLFVSLLGSVSRWGFASNTIEDLLPNADRALAWIQNFGDKDGDGFVEYERLNDRGLVNQGWKDSWDGINFADGTMAEPPIALCEVQAYVYAAYMARARIAYETGDFSIGDRFAARGERLKERFNEQFWLPHKGYYAVALDGEKRQVDACASNMGHCLWFGLVDKDKAPSVVEHLMSPQMFSGWGIRTLATDMGAYNPVSYHNGSVWPHDNAIIATGLMRYGFVSEAQRVAQALLEAADFSDGRLPELFCGFSRDEIARPVPYPTACSPQAWATTAPISLLTNLLQYDAYVSLGGLWMDPVLPDSFGQLHITNAPTGRGPITIDAAGSTVSVRGLPAGLQLHRGHRPWMPELVEQARAREQSS
ncbi:glycogen debranching N-terminal domain-containing protein [Arthrobacter sp. NPDC056727]|uniref:amylo-alpha-1,6-glucosidase n=1 Tax=Arthrobacter sp. NPDC056727 TaxID=3345927 RepID=UPI00366E469B